MIIPVLERNGGSCLIESCYRFCPVENNYKAFRPIADIRSRIENKRAEFHHTVGVHIRRGDHTVSAQASTTDKFIHAMENLREENPDITFFLCTDSIPLKNKLIRDFENRIIVNDIGSVDRNRREAIREALIDLFCLAGTEKIYGSYWSTFSQVAADIGGIEEISIK